MHLFGMDKSTNRQTTANFIPRKLKKPNYAHFEGMTNFGVITRDEYD